MSNTNQPPRTIEQKGLDRRGNSALAQAIDTGTPQPVDAAQQTATEQPGFTPGPWTTDGTAITTTDHHPQTVATTSPKICGPGMRSALANAALIAAAPSLHAYAKAEELRVAWIRADVGAEGNAAMEKYSAHLQTMGWDGVMSRPDFLATYRASALAKAGGAK